MRAELRDLRVVEMRRSILERQGVLRLMESDVVHLQDCLSYLFGRLTDLRDSFEHHRYPFFDVSAYVAAGLEDTRILWRSRVLMYERLTSMRERSILELAGTASAFGGAVVACVCDDLRVSGFESVGLYCDLHGIGKDTPVIGGVVGDVSVCVFVLLSFVDAFACSCVCKKWGVVFSDPLYWREYCASLHISLPLDSLAALRQYAWSLSLMRRLWLEYKQFVDVKCLHGSCR